MKHKVGDRVKTVYKDEGEIIRITEDERYVILCKNTKVTCGDEYLVEENESTRKDKYSLLWELLEPHIGHTIEIAKYGDSNISLEDMDTNEVIFDTDLYDLVGKEN